LELVKCFETSAMLAMVAGTDRLRYRRLVKLLKKSWKEPETALESEDDDPAKKDSIESALENFSFAVRKIEALKRIAVIAEKNAAFLKNFYLDRRLRNIKTALCGIRNCLKNVIEKLK